MNTEQFEARKREHIRHALDRAHQATGLTGLGEVHLEHEALPDFDFSEIRLDSICLGQKLATPFFIAGMTAGHSDAPRINRALALACERRGWAMGVGSQRRDLETRSGGLLDHWKQIRAEAPKLMLFANLGISQLIENTTDKVRALAELLEAQALVIHTNPLQEALQPEGTPRFRGALEALRQICRESGMPVVLKETGCGFSEATLKRLRDLGLAAIDVSGLGGTHWGRIEGARAEKTSKQSVASVTFANWGQSTASSVLAAKASLPAEVEIWASGGVRSGLDAGKLIALGAHRVGYAQPALEAALSGAEALDNWMEIQEFELKTTLFCTGCETPAELRQKEGAWKTSAI